MQIALKRCSSCNFWGSNTNPNDDGVLTSTCSANKVPDGALGLTSQLTKGSDYCSKWTKKLPPDPYDYDEYGYFYFPY